MDRTPVCAFKELNCRLQTKYSMLLKLCRYLTVAHSRLTTWGRLMDGIMEPLTPALLLNPFHPGSLGLKVVLVNFKIENWSSTMWKSSSPPSFLLAVCPRIKTKSAPFSIFPLWTFVFKETSVFRVYLLTWPGQVVAALGIFGLDLRYAGSLVKACGVWFPDQRLNPGPRVLGAQSLRHWTVRAPLPWTFYWLLLPL